MYKMNSPGSQYVKVLLNISKPPVGGRECILMRELLRQTIRADG